MKNVIFFRGWYDKSSCLLVLCLIVSLMKGFKRRTVLCAIKNKASENRGKFGKFRQKNKENGR